MQERNYQFSPPKSNPANHGIRGSLDSIELMQEKRAADVTQEDLGPAQLTQESIELLDQALNVASFSPSDLPYADQEKLQSAFHRLNQSTDLDAKKSVLKEIVRLVEAGVG